MRKQHRSSRIARSFGNQPGEGMRPASGTEVNDDRHQTQPPQALQLGAAAAGLTLLPGPRRAAAQGRHDHLLEHDLPHGGPDRQGQAAGRFLHLPGDRAVPGSESRGSRSNGDHSRRHRMFTKYRTASVAQNGPDVMGMWSGSYMLGVQDFLEPLNEYFTPEERERITGWEATSADFRPTPTRSMACRPARTARPVSTTTRSC